MSLTFALHRLDFGDSLDANGQSRSGEIGYDLDGFCTGQGEPAGPPGCVAPAWTKGPKADGPEGRDNSLGAHLTDTYGPNTFSTGVTALYQSGQQAALIRVRGYNGEADDDQVEVELYMGTLWSSPLAGAPKPRWDGHDRWSIGSPWVISGQKSGDLRPRYADTHAYVTGGVFVARFETLLLGNLYRTIVPNRHAILTAHLQRDGQGWKLTDGIVTGRAAIDDQLRALYRTDSADVGPPLCWEDGSEFEPLKKLSCAQVDIRADGDDASLPCNAISLATSFDAKQAELGEVVELPQPTWHCPTDPAAHGCGED